MCNGYWYPSSSTDKVWLKVIIEVKGGYIRGLDLGNSTPHTPLLFQKFALARGISDLV